jgi:very-short-patch-repair endonuclease
MRHRQPEWLRDSAKDQRAMLTRAEALMWSALRASRLDGWKFKRQVPFGRYIADFSCAEAKVIVELDGEPHHDPLRRTKDAARDAWFCEQGWQVLRFSNDSVLGGIALVCDEIRMALQLRASRAPSPLAPLPGRERGTPGDSSPDPANGRVERDEGPSLSRPGRGIEGEGLEGKGTP